MILSGWILPDLYEIQCASCYSKKRHIQIVKRYLDKLKEKDFSTFEKITDLLNEKKHFLSAIDDFAVIYLGWVKLIDLPEPFFFVAENSPLSFMTSRYEKLGYNITVLDSSIPLITPNISSKEIFNP